MKLKQHHSYKQVTYLSPRHIKVHHNMSVLISHLLEKDVIKHLEELAINDNILDFESTLRFIHTSKHETYREIPDFILESLDKTQIVFRDKYVKLLRQYSNSNFYD